jgi:hypothetical protein
MKPLLIVQEAKRGNVEAMRRGLGQCDGVIVLGMEVKVFWSLAGLDALFLTLPQAEAWGSKPLAPHVSEVLRTREAELKKGFPPHVVTGVTLKDGDPKTGRFTLPLVVTSAVRAVRNFNEGVGGPIQTVGLTEVERFAPDVSLAEMGELIRSGYEAALK